MENLGAAKERLPALQEVAARDGSRRCDEWADYGILVAQYISLSLSLSLEKIKANIISDLWNGANTLPRRRRMLLQSLGTMQPELLTMGLRGPIYPASLFKPARGMAIYRMEWRTTGSHCTGRPRSYLLGLSFIGNFQHLQIRNDFLVI